MRRDRDRAGCKSIRMYLGLCVREYIESEQKKITYEQKFTAIFKCSKINAVNIMDT